jgi:nucleotidyltransferase/DNA polymerase involved in DNA repair
LAGVPVAIQQHQDTIALSYKARALGLRMHALPAAGCARRPWVHPAPRQRAPRTSDGALAALCAAQDTLLAPFRR